jgi:hypothetical protein
LRDESGKKRREKGLARSRKSSGSAGHDPIGVAISPVPEGQHLAQWFWARTENARGTRKALFVALSHKLLISGVPVNLAAQTNIKRFPRRSSLPDVDGWRTSSMA